MNKAIKQPDQRRLLVFNCHEAWVYQLGVLGYQLDIITNLKGRYKQSWDEQIRPAPANSRFISLEQAQQTQVDYYCIIAHNISDLLDVKHRCELLHKYVELVGVHVVSVSSLKGNSWGFSEDIIPFSAEQGDYLPHLGEKACGLRICNFIKDRKKILLWDFHEESFAAIPVKLVGHNPEMAGVGASENWSQLKKMLQSYRFYIHTADPELEDGYNMATLEAMAAGMPVLGNRHPSSPVEDGVSGFLSDDPEELGKYARLLLEDKEQAHQMGQQARKTIEKRFSRERFKSDFLRSIEISRQKKLKRQVKL